MPPEILPSPPPAALFRALADETRLFMLALIRRHEELCVCDLERVLDITQSKASRHLRYLLNAGLVTDRRAAVWIYYRLSPRLSAAHQIILDSLDTLLDRATLDSLDDRLRAWQEEKRRCGALGERRLPGVPDRREALP